MRTIPSISHLFLALERNIINKFILIVIGGHIFNSKQRLLQKKVYLATSYGGLAIPRFHETAGIEFMSSSKITSQFTPLIKQRRLQYHILGDNLRKLKTKKEKLKEQNYKNVTKRITTETISKEQCLADLSTQT